MHFTGMTYSTSAKLPRETATKILDRAARLDGTDERIDLATLRSAALDAGISADAFERALVESMSTAPQATRHADPQRLNFSETAIKASVSGVVGGALVLAFLLAFAGATSNDLPVAAIGGAGVLAGVITYLKRKLKD